jgi:hypothetical protein
VDYYGQMVAIKNDLEAVTGYCAIQTVGRRITTP